MVRHLLWGIKVDDISFQGIPGGFPRYPAEALCLLKPLVPDELMIQDADFELCGPEKDLTWVLLDKDNPRRQQAMRFHLEDLQNKSFAIVKSLSLIISAGVSQAVFIPEPQPCAFHPFANVAQPPGASILLKTNPFKFWKEFIADLLERLPSDLRAALEHGDAGAVSVITRGWWGDVAAHRFVHTLLRLISSRLKCQFWMQDMYRLVPGIRALHDMSVAMARKKFGFEAGSPELKHVSQFLQLSDNEKLYKLLDGESLLPVLLDSIVLSSLIRSIVESFSHPFIVPSHSHTMTVVQTIVLQLIVLRMLNNSCADESLFKLGREDVLVCWAYLKRTLMKSRNLAVTGAGHPIHKKDDWEVLLFDKLQRLDVVDEQWVAEFYSKSMYDIL